MNYNELLNKLSSGMASATKNSGSRTVNNNAVSTPKEDTTSTMLNKIGLEVQRQGGY
jgi:hypothetical protein